MCKDAVTTTQNLDLHPDIFPTMLHMKNIQAYNFLVRNMIPGIMASLSSWLLVRNVAKEDSPQKIKSPPPPQKIKKLWEYTDNF
jgi:hypothetical protein